MENFIVYTIIGMVVSLMMVYLQKATGVAVKPDSSGKCNLRMHKLYVFLGYIGLVIGFIFLLFPLLIDEEIDLQEYFILLGMVLGIFWGAGLPCLLWYRNHKVRFDDYSFEVTNVYGKRRSMEWEKVQFIKFNRFLGLLVITDDKQEKVKIHQHLVGLSEFVAVLERKTMWTAKELKLPISMKSVA